MGQKAHPKGLRLGIVEDWESSWYAEKDYSRYILVDRDIRAYVKEHFKRGGVSKLRINRKADVIEVVVHAARTGVLLGKGGEAVTAHRKALGQKLGLKVNIKIVEEKDPEKNARLLAESICAQLEKRIPFRRAMKAAVQWAMKAGAEGVKVACAGRLGGVEIARSEWYREGKVPLHTLRASIDYAFSEALTTYGKIGVKVWVYNGDIIEHNKRSVQEVVDQQVDSVLADTVSVA
ncbi:MAG: 30S ribosomal protein S3 [bacterium]|nr:30S ribosomal protein S3 [bacterium]